MVHVRHCPGGCYVDWACKGERSYRSGRAHGCDTWLGNNVQDPAHVCMQVETWVCEHFYMWVCMWMSMCKSFLEHVCTNRRPEHSSIGHMEVDIWILSCANGSMYVQTRTCLFVSSWAYV